MSKVTVVRDNGSVKEIEASIMTVHEGSLYLRNGSTGPGHGPSIAIFAAGSWQYAYLTDKMIAKGEQS